MYPIEYTWTNEETINTGINIETVNESKLKLQDIFNDSESIHLKFSTCTGTLFIPTSINAKIDKIVVIINDVQAIRWDPLTPTFLPKNPEVIEANKGKIIIVKYIIWILWLYFLLIYKMQLIFLNL